MLTVFTINNTDFLSYATIKEADAFLLLDPIRGDAWTTLNDADKQSRLIAMKRRLNVFNWKGTQAEFTTRNPNYDANDPNSQENLTFDRDAWPRNGVSINGVDLPNNEVPEAIAEATIIGAAASIINPAILQANKRTNSKIKKVSDAGSSVEYFHDNNVTIDIHSFAVTEPDIQSLIQPFLRTASASQRGSLSGISSGNKGSYNDNPDYDDRLAQGF